jgi:CBS domain containing-hemolysin-like protein
VLTAALLLVASLLLVAACGAFVAAEFSLVTVDRAAIERAAADGDRRSTGVLAALRSLSTQLSGVQLAITVTNLAIGYLAEPAIATLLEPVLARFGLGAATVTGVAVTLALVLATGLTVVFGELVPKNLAVAAPLATARAVQGLSRGFARAAKPAITALNGTANVVLRLLGIEPQEELASARSPEELASLVTRSADEGVLESGTARMVRRALTLGDRDTAEVMTPRVRVYTVAADAPVTEVVELARRTGRSRFPVVGTSLDDVLGVVSIRQVVAVPRAQRPTTPVRSVMVAPLLVPGTVPVDDLLARLRGSRLQLAVVVDEFGGMDGIATLEDAVEEIVGDVVDEHDRSSPQAVRRADGDWSLAGLLRPDEVSDLTGLLLPESDHAETLAGLVVVALGRIPEVGDTATLRLQPVVVLDDDADVEAALPVDATATVTAMDRRRVDRVRLVVQP